MKVRNKDNCKSPKEGRKNRKMIEQQCNKVNLHLKKNNPKKKCCRKSRNRLKNKKQKNSICTIVNKFLKKNYLIKKAHQRKPLNKK